MLFPPKLFYTSTKKPEVGLVWKIFCSRILKKRKKIWWRPLQSPPRLAKGAQKPKLSNSWIFFIFPCNHQIFGLTTVIWCWLTRYNYNLRFRGPRGPSQGPQGPIPEAPGAYPRGPRGPSEWPLGFKNVKNIKLGQIHGQYVVSDTHCPALHDYELVCKEAGQRPRRGRSPVEHGNFHLFVLANKVDKRLQRAD